MMAVIIGFLAVSCQQSWLDEVTSTETDFLINVAVPEDVTRSAGSNSALGAIGNIDLGEFDIRYILEVYDGNGTLAYGPLVNCEDNELATSFTLRLVPGRKYTFAVWADFVEQGKDEDYHYITANGLRNIKINEQNYDAMDESCDAYTGIAVINNYNSTSTIDVELKRPFAKLRVVTTDINEMFNLTPSSATVSYTSNSFYTEFDAYTSDVKGEPAAFNGERVIDLTEKRYENEPNPAESGVMTLFADYLFAKHEARGINFVMDVLDANGQTIPQVVFNTEIPVQRNHLTTIAGSILTDFNKVEVTIKPEFDGELEGICPPDNIDPNMVIRYTATRKVLDYDWNSDTFGANILYHSFANGEGIIVFDSEVTKIGHQSFGSEFITTIDMPETVTVIEYNAFSTSTLQSITIPKAVKVIENMAFYHTPITNISFEEGCELESIGNSAFSHCSSLKSITLPSTVTSVGPCVFGGCKQLSSISGSGDYYNIGVMYVVDDDVDSYTYKVIACPSGYIADRLDIGGMDSKILWGAFTYGNIKSIDIQIKEIDQYNFIYDDVLEDINLNITTVIANNVLTECSKLKYLYLPVVETVGEGSFGQNASLESIEIGSAYFAEAVSIANNNPSLKRLSLESGVTKIANSFNNCGVLEEIRIKSVTPPVFEDSFDSLPAEAKIYVPIASYWDYVTADGWVDLKEHIVAYDYEYGQVVNMQPENCEIWYTNGSATEPTIPNDVDALGGYIVSNEYNSGYNHWVLRLNTDITTVGDVAFSDCTTLIGITLPASVTEIGAAAFSGCSNLKKINLSDNIVSIEDEAFEDCVSLESIIIPKGVTIIGNEVFRKCSSLTRVLLHNDITEIRWRAFSFCSSLSNITIPDSVTAIAREAFSGCDNLREISIPYGVTNVEMLTFSNCRSLTNVTIPDSVTSIGLYAFYGCSSLTELTLPYNVSEISASALSACSSLVALYCQSFNPPTCGSEVMYGYAPGCKIYVPMGAVDAYKSAEGWSYYADIIEGYNF